MNGNFNLTNDFKKAFAERCQQLLIEGYMQIRANNSCDKSWSEENISAHFIHNMENLPLAIEHQIDIKREIPVDTDAIINHGQKARSASRMDIYFFKTTWTRPKTIQYYAVEAKNVSAKDWLKASGVKVPSATQRKEYITKGIEEFVQGNYPKGCMIAYVVNGKITPIIDDINTRIKKNSFYPDDLGELSPSPRVILGFTEIYESTCKNQPNNKLKHFFFDFA